MNELTIKLVKGHRWKRYRVEHKYNIPTEERIFDHLMGDFDQGCAVGLRPMDLDDFLAIASIHNVRIIVEK